MSKSVAELIAEIQKLEANCKKDFCFDVELTPPKMPNFAEIKRSRGKGRKRKDWHR